MLDLLIYFSMFLHYIFILFYLKIISLGRLKSNFFWYLFIFQIFSWVNLSKI